MCMRPWFLEGVGALAVGLLVPAASAAGAFSSDEAVREILRQRIEVSRLGVGCVVALVDESGARVVSHGLAKSGERRPVDGDTVFQVGSVTKVFTSLLLAQMAARGEVRLDDPIALYAPPVVTTTRAREITLLHLSRHTAGFMSFADNLEPAAVQDPADAPTNDAMFTALDLQPMRAATGVHHSYSSYGAALLGELLARRAATDFESAVRARILEPLGMTRSGFALTPPLRAAHATGHTARGEPRAHTEARSMLGSGALRSSANDLARFRPGSPRSARLGARRPDASDAAHRGRSPTPRPTDGTGMVPRRVARQAHRPSLRLHAGFQRVRGDGPRAQPRRRGARKQRPRRHQPGPAPARTLRSPVHALTPLRDEASGEVQAASNRRSTPLRSGRACVLRPPEAAAARTAGCRRACSSRPRSRCRCAASAALRGAHRRGG